MLHLHIRGVLHYFLYLLNHLQEREAEVRPEAASRFCCGRVDGTCSAVSSGSSVREDTMMECMSSCSLSSSSSHGSSEAFL